MFGEIAGIAEGTVFASRTAAMHAQVHRANQSGIVGPAAIGAESVVVSGGYPDDDDHGTWILYTGQGGRDATSGRQNADQEFKRGNAALVTSMVKGHEVRLVRGADRESEHAPDSGYRYDGLFRVDDAYFTKGVDGFRICQFRMVKISSTVDLQTARVPVALDGTVHHVDTTAGNMAPGQRVSTARRTIRVTKVVKDVKAIHNDTCQMCGLRLDVGGRGYSEGAHIKALGAPHDGPDVATNVLCLCPNCHVLFDYGAMTVQADHSLQLNGADAGELKLHPGHKVDDKYFEYHREAHGKA